MGVNESYSTSQLKIPDRSADTKKAPESTEAFWFRLQYDDVTGALMQCISRPPQTYHRIVKIPRRKDVDD